MTHLKWGTHREAECLSAQGGEGWLEIAQIKGNELSIVFLKIPPRF